MGRWRLSQKRYSDAEKMLEAALERDPSNAQAMQTLVASYLTQKQLPKALNRVKQQVQKTPSSRGMYTLLGTLQADSGDYASAEASLQKAIDLDHNNMAAFMSLGRVQVAHGSVDKAVSTWQAWIQQSPKDVQAYVMLGSLEESRNNWQKGQELYKKALELRPDFPIAANNLAYSMLEHGGNTDVALSLAQTARRAMPDSPNAADTLAYAYIQKGVSGMAIDLLNDALKNDPKDATFEYHLGMAYQRNGDATRAREHFEKALKLDPKLDDAKKALSSLKS